MEIMGQEETGDVKTESIRRVVYAKEGVGT